LTRSLMRRYGLFPHQRFRNPQLEAFLATYVPPYPGPGPMFVKLRECLSFADRVRLDSIDLAAFAGGDAGRQILRDVINDYCAHLETNHFADFTRLELLILERLRQNQLQTITNTIQAIVVDEFQDTNYLQEQIYLELCSRTSASLTVVGDDDQSIFRFRGATVEIFANFEARIVHALGTAWTPARFDLANNYRSASPIVDFCNRFAQMDPTFQAARVANKPPLIASASHSLLTHPPVLGMFRTDCQQLATDLCAFLSDVFQGSGYVVQCANQSYTISRPHDGDFGDAVLLSHRAQEYTNADPPKPRLPLFVRNILEQNHNVPVFNPRGRNLGEIQSVRQLLGLALICIDGNGAALQSIPSMSIAVRSRLTLWRAHAESFVLTNPQPTGLGQFIQYWQTRTLPPNSHMDHWPNEWPLLELIFTLVTWIPELQRSPEGQVYLEALARTVAEAGQFSAFHGLIRHGAGQYDQASVVHAIRGVFENIADENVEVDEEIMPYVPRSYFPIMTIHQAKGLEFPLVIVDVGSDFSRNHPAQRKFRFPEGPDTVHEIENLISAYCPIGPARIVRNGTSRAWDDLRRLYFVGYSRAENVLLLVGLTSQLGNAPKVKSVATGDLPNMLRQLNFIPAAQWDPSLLPGNVALI
jgi:DNA helicase II / ATP-dependent DNA helicase PcrA